MLLYKITKLKEYAKLITEKNEETKILYQDLLINVTSFFRDTDSHKYLEEKLFPKMLSKKKEGESFRVWVQACSTGEEAYSIAMMLLEINESRSLNIPIQIFATDLSENAISKARIGVYAKQELETVSPKRIQRFFTKTNGSFRVNKALRDMCVFAPHNVLRDPPFSRLDFISCRNLLIYLDTAAQKKAVNTFHYALNNDGFLMLGKSENISQSSNLFSTFHEKYKIFSRKINSGSKRLPELSPRFAQKSVSEKNIPIANRNRSQINISTSQQGLDKAIDEVLVSEFMPASVVIDYQMEIVQFRGTTDLFLTHPKGKATFNILKMARPEIAFELRNSISKAIKTKERIRKSGIELKVNSDIRIISFEIVPLESDSISIGWNEPLLLIVFTDHEQAEYNTQANGSETDNPSAKEQRIKKLEQQLAAARVDALSASQEQEAFAEELQSANEEVVSSNEELQTVNEELETSKEEIESSNEELITTNQELQTRIDLLNESYEYSKAIVSTMHDPMLVLGKDLRVKSANEAFYKTFDVTEEQTEGMLLYELGNKQWDIPALRELLEDIIPKNTHFYNFEVKQTFKNIGEKILSLNANQIIQKTHREQLILLIISDITEVRRLILEKEEKEKDLLEKEIHDRKTEKLKLEKAVEERTQELKEANEKLDTRNKELLNINKELEAFTYVSSHDLQEPLRKLQTFAGLILEKENQHLSDKGKNYFQLMQKGTERMRQLIQDLLAFSRISTDQREFKETKLSSIIDEVKDELKDPILLKGAIIEVSEKCKVKIIPFQFRQLMHNLIGNALKYSNPQIPPHIKIRCQNVKYEKLNIKELPAHEKYCHISISDNGIGFEQKFSTKIFEVFQKLHGKDEYAGTGIGLAIVKKIVDNHNGIITATSEPNKGATFNIYLPSNQTANSISQKK
jgi:two-component system CheB/CheR fusion protein